MYHRPSKFRLSNPEFGNISEQSDPGCKSMKRYFNWCIMSISSLLERLHVVARYNIRTRVCYLMQCLALSSILWLFVPASFAEHTDRDKPLYLEADQVLIDDTNKTSSFTGNVRLAQGTMLIRGDRIEVSKTSDGFQQAKAYGNTATFRQKREGLDEYVEGYGERIEYDSRAGTVDFYGQARVKRDLDEVRGDHITYSMKNETFQVSGSASTTNTPPKRVRAVLQPKANPSTTAPSSQVLPDGTQRKNSAVPE